MEPFHPSPETARAFRDALGHYATGVTVVIAESDGQPLAITVNSFASVSLDPPLVLWCPAKGSSRFATFLDADRYSIHVLAADQRDLGLRLARSGSDFGRDRVERTEHGFYRLPGCLAWFECLPHAAHDGGDHAILVGQVQRAACRPGDPLIFWGGRYGDFLQHGI